MTPWRTIVIGLVALVVSNHISYLRGQNVQKASDEVAANIIAQDAVSRATIGIAQADKEHQAQLEKANAENDKLRADIASGARKLRIKATRPSFDPDGSNSSVGNAATYAELSPEDANAVLQIARDGDDAIRQLGAAQEIIRALTQETAIKPIT